MRKQETFRKAKSFEQKTAEIFELMGYETELNHRVAGNDIDILIRKKEDFGGERYKFYICECKDFKENVGVEWVNKYVGVWHASKNALLEKHKGSNCDAIIIARTGFTESSKETADFNGVILTTYDQLLADLMNFDRYLTYLIAEYESDPIKDRYIEQDVFSEKEKKSINSFRFVEEWLTNPARKQFSLLGDYGTGKTSFAKRLAYNMAKNYKKQSDGGRIPYLVDLRECQKAFSLKNLLHEQLSKQHIKPVNEKIFLKLLAEGKILLIFDGFDEMATMSNAEVTLSNFRQLNEAVTGKSKVILTSRTHYFRDKDEVEYILEKEGKADMSEHATLLYREISGKPEYEIVYLKEFDDRQVIQYLKKVLPQEWKYTHQKINGIYNLEDLSHRPVLLDMIVKTLPRIDLDRDNEFNVVHLYEAYTQFWFDREDYRLQITNEGKHELVQELALQLWQKEEKSIHYSELAPILEIHLKARIKTSRDLEIADYEVRTASFLIRDSDGNYSFAHRSFHEFFIALKIKKELLNRKLEILNLRPFSLEIIFFLRHLMADDEKLISTAAQLLSEPYRKNVSENAFLIFYNLIKMACFKQQFSLKSEVEFASEEVRAFQDSLKQYLPSNLNLSHAVLSGHVMSYMVFKNTDFSDAIIDNAVLTHNILEDVNFIRASLKSSDFSDSVLMNAKFVNSSASNCDFKNCTFDNCVFLKSAFRLSNFLNVKFINCVFEDNNFTGTGFLGSNFRMSHYKNNRIYGAGQHDVLLENLSPFLKIGHDRPVNSIYISKDNSFLVSGSNDNTIKIWDFETGILIKTIESKYIDGITTVTVSHDSRYIVSGSHDSFIKIWNLENGKLLRTIKAHNGTVTSVSLSSDSLYIASGGVGNITKLWDLETGKLIKSFKGHKKHVKSVMISSDNRYLVTGSEDHTVKLWYLKSGRLAKTFKGHTSSVNSVFISFDNKYIVSSDHDNKVILWERKSGEIIKTFEEHKSSVNSVSLSSDNRILVSGDYSGEMKIWDIEKDDSISTIDSIGGSVTSVQISTDGHYAVSGSADSTIKKWDIVRSRLERTFDGFEGIFYSASLSLDGKNIAFGGHDGNIRIMNLENLRIIMSFKAHSSHVDSLKISNDKQWVVSGSDEEIHVKLWGLNNRLFKVFKGHNAGINCVSISSDNRWLISGSNDYTIKMWDISDERLIHTLKGHERVVAFVSFSWDNQWIISGSDYTIKIWHSNSGRLIKTIKTKHNGIDDLFLSRDNHLIVSCGFDGDIQLWDIDRNELINTFEGHTDAVNCVFMSQDHKLIFSGGYDNSARLWDAESGVLLKTFYGFSGWVTFVFINLEKRLLITGCTDNTIKYWDIESGELIYTISLLPGNNAILFKNNKYLPSCEESLQFLYYTDQLASYPARNLPLLRMDKREMLTYMTRCFT